MGKSTRRLVALVAIGCFWQASVGILLAAERTKRPHGQAETAGQILSVQADKVGGLVTLHQPANERVDAPTHFVVTGQTVVMANKQPIALGDLTFKQWVTVDYSEQNGQFVATAITVGEPPAKAPASSAAKTPAQTSDSHTDMKPSSEIAVQAGNEPSARVDAPATSASWNSSTTSSSTSESQGAWTDAGSAAATTGQRQEAQPSAAASWGTETSAEAPAVEGYSTTQSTPVPSSPATRRWKTTNPSSGQ